MATSGSVNYSLDVDQIIQAAFELIGVAAIGDPISAGDAAKGREQLNLMVKTWGADPSDLKLWLITEGTVVLLASTASYALTAARKVLSVRRRTSSIDTPLTLMSHEDYYNYPSKSASGMPTQYYFDPQRAARTLYVVSVPDATIAASTTLQYTYLRVIEDLDSFSDDFDVPQEWLEVIQYGLAARLSVPYRQHITDPAGAAKIEARAQALYAQLASYDDEPGSMFFQPA